MTTDAGGAVSAIAQQAEERYEQVRGEVGDVDRRLRDTIDQYPLATFFGAVLAGYLFARLTTRV
jgi:NADH:ubiquinone oxidoreductase subunit F (NADH-binding)